MSIKLSYKTIIFIFITFSIHFYNKIDRIVADKDNCICSYDGFGYYMYSPYLFSQGSLNINSKWAKSIQNKYCDSAIVYQFQPTKNGNELNIYHMGLSFVQLPFYIVAETIAIIFDYEKDGFSKPYHILYILNVLFWIFIGLIYLRKLLLLLFSDQLSSFIILTIYLGTNVLITFGLQYDLTHLYLFSLNSIFLYHLLKFYQNISNRNLIYAAIILGLTVCIRPTQVVLGILPLFILLHIYKQQKGIALKKLLWFPLFGIIWNLPQIYYWYSIGGNFFQPNLHTEEIIIIDPNIFEFLFSYKKGWLVYSPIFLLLILGFYQLKKKNSILFWSILVFTCTYIYVMSSWECWWYAYSFGSRVMVDIYPILALVIGYAFIGIQQKKIKWVLYMFSALCIFLSLFQSYQLSEYIIHPERMTKEQYWYVFGKTDISKLSSQRLEIDRNDTDWINHLDEFEDIGIKHKRKTIYQFKGPLTAKPKIDLRIDDFKLLEKVPNDETCLIVNFKAMTSDSTKSSILKMETESKYNCYGWDNIEISRNNIQNNYNAFRLQFNLKNIRHLDDKMYIYIDNDEDVTTKIKDFKIEAITLIRK